MNSSNCAGISIVTASSIPRRHLSQIYSPHAAIQMQQSGGYIFQDNQIRAAGQQQQQQEANSQYITLTQLQQQSASNSNQDKPQQQYQQLMVSPKSLLFNRSKNFQEGTFKPLHSNKANTPNNNLEGYSNKHTLYPSLSLQSSSNLSNYQDQTVSTLQAQQIESINEATLNNPNKAKSSWNGTTNKQSNPSNTIISNTKPAHSQSPQKSLIQSGVSSQGGQYQQYYKSQQQQQQQQQQYLFPKSTGSSGLNLSSVIKQTQLLPLKGLSQEDDLPSQKKQFLKESIQGIFDKTPSGSIKNKIPMNPIGLQNGNNTNNPSSSLGNYYQQQQQQLDQFQQQLYEEQAYQNLVASQKRMKSNEIGIREGCLTTKNISLVSRQQLLDKQSFQSASNNADALMKVSAAMACLPRTLQFQQISSSVTSPSKNIVNIANQYEMPLISPKNPKNNQQLGLKRSFSTKNSQQHPKSAINATGRNSKREWNQNEEQYEGASESKRNREQILRLENDVDLTGGKSGNRNQRLGGYSNYQVDSEDLTNELLQYQYGDLHALREDEGELFEGDQEEEGYNDDQQASEGIRQKNSQQQRYDKSTGNLEIRQRLKQLPKMNHKPQVVQSSLQLMPSLSSDYKILMNAEQNYHNYNQLSNLYSPQSSLSRIAHNFIGAMHSKLSQQQLSSNVHSYIQSSNGYYSGSYQQFNSLGQNPSSNYFYADQGMIPNGSASSSTNSQTSTNVPPSIPSSGVHSRGNICLASQNYYQNLAQKNENGTGSEKCYKYVVNYGNNCLIVERVMSTRENWKPIEPHNQAYNFKWCPLSQVIRYERLGVGVKQLVNHLESHTELTCKYTLLKNLQLHSLTNPVDLFTITPLTFLIDLDNENCEGQLRFFSKFFIKHSSKQQKIISKSDNGAQNSQNNAKKMQNDFIRQLVPLMQFQSSLRSSKAKNPSMASKPKMHESFVNGDNYFWFLKPTGTNRGRGIFIFNTLEQLQKYIIDYNTGIEEKPLVSPQNSMANGSSLDKSKKKQDQQQSSLSEGVLGRTENQEDGEEQDEQCLQNQKQFQQGQDDNIAVVKQQVASDKKEEMLGFDAKKRKAGIQPITSGATNATTSTANNPPASVIKCRQFVVQKYVERPLLIHGRKFDIRFWVIVTHTMDVYYFKESVIRTSGQQFNLDSSQINNQFIHLTNNAVQRYAENYGQFESGNQMSLASFFRYCKETYPTCDTAKMLEDMKSIVVHTMQSVKRKINPEDRKFTFELYGYDFLIDSAFNVWLLEVNTNPCLDESSPHLQQVLPRLLDDAFKLTLDVIFPRTKIIAKEYLQMGQSGIAMNNKSGVTPNGNANKGNSQLDQQIAKVGITQTKKEELNISIEESEEELKQVKQIGLADEKNENNNDNSPGNVERTSEVIGSETTGGTGEQEIGEEQVMSNSNTHSSSKQKKSESQWEASTKQNGLNNAKDTDTKKNKDSSAKQPGSGGAPYILNSKKQTNWPVDGHPDDENMWELLCSISVPKTKPTPKRPTF